VHRANLMGGQGLAEQINRGHLPAEHPLLVQFRSGADVAFVERLERRWESCDSTSSEQLSERSEIARTGVIKFRYVTVGGYAALAFWKNVPKTFFRERKRVQICEQNKLKKKDSREDCYTGCLKIIVFRVRGLVGDILTK
jgi:hypothetical protein